MKYKILIFSLTLLNLLNHSTHSTFAQEPGQFAISINGTYSQPIGGLSNWFKASPNYGISFGQQYNEKWFIEGVLEFSRYDRENLSGYPQGKLDLLLEHYSLMVSGKYELLRTKLLKPYFHVAAGIFQWKGVRGEIQADASVIPNVPYIAEKKLQETNWGFRSGLGTEVRLLPNLSMDFLAYYRFIVGDLWPTLQPNIELEGVSGFQTLNLALAVRYYF